MQASLVELKDVCKFVRGLTYSKKDEVEHSSTPVLRATNIDLGSHQLTYDDIRYISDDIKVKSEKIASQGDILMCTASGSKSHLGKVALVGQCTSMAFGGFMAALRPTADCDSKYLFYQLISPAFKTILSSVSDGANINNLKFSQIENFSFLLPPLDEQHRIVAKLDKAFAEIDCVYASTAKKIEAVAQLYISCVDQLFFRKGVELVELKKIASIKGGKRLPKGKSLVSSPTPYPYIRVSDFTDTGTVDVSSVQYIDESVQREIARYTISKDDVYISIAGTIGKTGIVPKSLDNANLTENAAKIVLSEECLRDYFYYFTTSRSFAEQALAQTRTAAQPKLALSRLGAVRFPLPELREQREVIDKARAITEQTQKAREKYNCILSALSSLKGSLLSAHMIEASK